MRRRPLALVVLAALAACGGGDGTSTDAAAIDAPAIDAAVDAAIDAAIDAPPDAAPLRCTETTETLIDIAPRRFLRGAALGTTLYLTTYTPADLGAGGELLAISMTDLSITPIATNRGLANVRAVDGWLYVADSVSSGGSVWRYQPGQPIQTLATGRVFAGTITADATQVYWREGPQIAPMLMRAPLAGGAPTPIAAVEAYELVVDDQYLYAGASRIQRFRKDNWFSNWSSPQLLALTGLILDGGELLALDDRGILAIQPPAAEFTPLASEPNLQRHAGLALAGGYLWATAGLAGVERAPRAGGAFEPVTATWASTEPVFAGGYLTWSVDGVLHRCRP